MFTFTKKKKDGTITAIKPENEKMIKQSLTSNETEADFSSMKLGGEEARLLADVLNANQTLKTLYLTWNSIGDEGAGLLAETLKDNQTLIKINLSANSIGHKGAGALADALKVNQTLQTIHLGSNSIGDEGAGKLAEALNVNQTLQVMGLWNNSIGDEGAEKLGYALACNETLWTVHLNNNPISSNILSKIRLCVKDPGRVARVENKRVACRKNFYSMVVNMTAGQQNNELKQLNKLIEDLYETKLFYTVVASLLRARVLTEEESSLHISAALEKSVKFCTGAVEVSEFKLILEKAESDGFIDRKNMHFFDNQAERNAVFTDRRFVNLMEAVKSNTARIEGLEANIAAINNSVNAIRKGLKHKMKVEAVVGFLSATINVISFGVGGNILAATASALGSIVDYGDIVHIRTVAALYGDACVDQVEAGVDIALNKYADAKLEEALKKGNTLTVVAAAAVMMQPTAPTETLDNEDSETMNLKGYSAFRQGDYVGAINHYTNSINKNSRSSILFCNRSVAYRKMGDSENALIDASTAITLDPKYARAYYCKGLALQELKKFDDALAAFEEGVSISPDALLKTGLNQLLDNREFKLHRAEVLNKEGDTLFDTGDFSQAVECYSNAINLDKSNHLLFLGRASAYMELGDFDNALRDATVSIDFDSNNPRGYHLKGRAFQSMKFFREAASAFEEGLSKFPNAVELKDGLTMVNATMRLQAGKKDPDFDHIYDIAAGDAKDKGDAAFQRPDYVMADIRSQAYKKYPDGDDVAERDNESKAHYEAAVADSETFEFGIVERLLLTWLHGVDRHDIIRYSKCLVDDGFDTIDALRTVEDDDLHFMKKGHKRVLLKKIWESNDCFVYKYNVK